MQDPELVEKAKVYKNSIDNEWDKLQKLCNKYPDILPLSKITKSLYIFVSGNVMTRCFGYTLPCTMMIPFADNINHSTIDSFTELFDEELHINAIGKTIEDKKLNMYGTKEKMEVDFSDFGKAYIDEENKNISIKQIVVNNDITDICINNNKLKNDANIWNM